MVEQLNRCCLHCYLACAIQGEGMITLSKRKHKKSARGFYLEPKVSVSNTEKEWIEYLKSISGFGYVHKDDSPSRKKHGWKIEYSWNVCDLYDLYFLLQSIEKYLIGEKLILCRLLKEYCKLRLNSKRIYHRDEKGRFKKGEQIIYTNKMLEIFKKIKELNKKGRNKNEKT